MEDPQDSLKSQPILHNNYRHADWASDTDFTESAFSALPPPSSCSIGEKTFRNILRDASVRFIPRGSIPNYTPHFSDAAKLLTSERDRLRATDPQNPEIAILNNSISDELDSSARSAWTERVMAATPKDNSTKFYSLLRSFSGKKTAVAPNQPIMFGNGSLSNTTSIARAFCKQFTGCSLRRTRASCRLRRLIKRRPLDQSFLLFTSVQVREAIMASGNSTAPVPTALTIWTSSTLNTWVPQAFPTSAPSLTCPSPRALGGHPLHVEAGNHHWPTQSSQTSLFGHLLSPHFSSLAHC